MWFKIIVAPVCIFAGLELSAIKDGNADKENYSGNVPRSRLRGSGVTN